MIRRVVVGVAALLLIVCYAPILLGMFDQWLHDEDMSHGIIVPVAISWIVWRERNRWLSLPVRPSLFGFVLLFAAACLHAMAVMGGGLFAGSVAFLLSVAGVVLCLGGFEFLRSWIFPFLLALFMLPKLAVVYNQATLPLQLLAARLAEGMLSLGRASVTREGNILAVGGHSVAVAEACSGVRYLLSLGFVAALFAYLFDPKSWMRVALLTAAVPVAILANALRVAVSASVPALDSGPLHDFLGVLVFVMCLGMLAITHRLLNAAYGRCYHA